MTIRYGQKDSDHGGGIIHDTGALTLQNCAVKDNSISGDNVYGAGIFTCGVEVVIKDSVISGNIGTSTNDWSPDGGGMEVDYGSLTMSGTTVSGNHNKGPGGGMYLFETKAIISDSVITGNVAEWDGGGFVSEASTVMLTNCELSGNNSLSPDFGGGAIFTKGSTMEINNCTINDNTAVNESGGIHVFDGAVIISDSTISGNQADDDGGGIKNKGFLWISNTTIGGNIALDSGGGIYNEGILRLTNSTISGNSATDNGGGIKNLEGDLQTYNTTISDNTTGSDGGGLFNHDAIATISFTTITDNTAQGFGGGILNSFYMTLDNSIVAGNNVLAVDPDRGTDIFSPSVHTESNGGNLIGTNNGDQTTNLFPAGSPNINNDYVGEDGAVIDPLLEALADNGGPTQTHALSSASSPAVDHAVDIIFSDQRGAARPYPTYGSCDIGAFEYHGRADLVLTKSVDNAAPLTGDQIIYTVTIKNNGPNQAAEVTVTDSLPNGLTYVSDDSGGDFDSTSGIWTVGNINAGVTFDGWTGTSCPGNDDCVLTLEAGLTVTATFNTDADGDGISDEVEATGPNNGDANYDNAQDSSQAGVVSFTNIDGEYVYLEAQSGITISEVKALTNPSEEDAPDGIDFAYDFFSFKLRGLANGGSTTVALHLPLNKSVTTYYKYGPTPDDQNDHWYDFSFDETSGTGAVITHGDETVISLTLTDGRRGDSDLTANAAIYDPGAPASGQMTGGSGGGGGGCFCSTLAGDSINGPGESRYHFGLLWFVLVGFAMVIGYRRWRQT